MRSSRDAKTEKLNLSNHGKRRDPVPLWRTTATSCVSQQEPLPGIFVLKNPVGLPDYRPHSTWHGPQRSPTQVPYPVPHLSPNFQKRSPLLGFQTIKHAGTDSFFQNQGAISAREGPQKWPQAWPEKAPR
ncbi:Uncharacterised protein [Mycobacteroides abscessus subsp. abscessus]|nr:Uncharacterised protein [Mycobacteroides abscessus subsp. abscessus]SKY60454.1 Uncharacterised protein [Mycobacteroides abscessus subsp. abscessus]